MVRWELIPPVEAAYEPGADMPSRGYWAYGPRIPRAGREHRHHAVVEQVIADSEAGAPAHLPCGHFHADAAWLAQWA